MVNDLSFAEKSVLRSSKNLIPPSESLDSGSKILSSSHELLHSIFLFTNIYDGIPTSVAEDSFIKTNSFSLSGDHVD